MSAKTTVADCIIINLPQTKEINGNSTSITDSTEIPFPLKRVFYLYDIPYEESRGAHAHKTCHQFLVAVSGSFEVLLEDGKEKRKVLLNNPKTGIHIPPGIWDSQLNFSSGAICLVIASKIYLEEDYIRNYDDFLRYKADK